MSIRLLATSRRMAPWRDSSRPNTTHCWMRSRCAPRHASAAPMVYMQEWMRPGLRRPCTTRKPSPSPCTRAHDDLRRLHLVNDKHHQAETSSRAAAVVAARGGRRGRVAASASAVADATAAPLLLQLLLLPHDVANAPVVAGIAYVNARGVAQQHHKLATVVVVVRHERYNTLKHQSLRGTEVGHAVPFQDFRQ
mmetsp:Transcript_54848/g.134431  ORF Transcript_54848/g.134431 Transcript_54848/m.134431 type:complete len:194 (-) Transcript_54848:550-1131(-)